MPIFKRLGLGSVLGYLAAGVAIGPFLLALVSDVDAILHFGEFGVARREHRRTFGRDAVLVAARKVGKVARVVGVGHGRGKDGRDNANVR